MVPKKGLEPPHPCEYVDLNHARLPIPPLRHGTVVQRVSAEQAASLSLAKAALSVKFRAQITPARLDSWAGTTVPAHPQTVVLNQLGVERDLGIVGKKL